MSRTYRALTTLALSLALAATAATAALAAPPTGSSDDLNDRLLQSIEAGQAERTQAALEQARAGERNLVPVVTVTPQPLPAAPSRDVDVVAIALLGLIGGLLGGAAVVAGTAASRRRHRVVAA